MSAVFDFLPVLVFVVVYFVGGHTPETSQQLAQSLISGLVRDGVVPRDLAALMLATGAAIVTISLQMLYMTLRRKRIGVAQWLTFFIFVGFGGATIYFHDGAFIKLKPTVISWIFAVSLTAAQLIFKRNLVHDMLSPNGIKLPAPVWKRLLVGYILFFFIVGLVNLYVAFTFSLDTWVSFKLFGVAGMSLAFGILQAVYLARHLEECEPAPEVVDPASAGEAQ